MTASSMTPEDVRMTPRNTNFDIEQALARDWHSNDPFKTAFFNALSMLFPIGEKHFIDSVAEFKDCVTDEKLQSDVRNFTVQEALHTREHRKYNEHLCRQRGYDLNAMEGRMERDKERLDSDAVPKIMGLYTTVATEHLTGVLGDQILKNPAYLEGADPVMASMWRWHAYEEVEHKAVAFDVLTAAGGSTKGRNQAMRLMALRLTQFTTFNINHMLKRDGYSFFQRMKIWAGGLKWLCGKGGLLRESKADFHDYFRADFHPWQHDNRHLLTEFEEEVEALAA